MGYIHTYHIYTYICTYIHTYMHACIHTYIHIIDVLYVCPHLSIPLLHMSFFPLDAVTLGLRCFNRGFSPISAAGPGATGAALLKSLIYVQDQHEKSDHK